MKKNYLLLFLMALPLFTFSQNSGKKDSMLFVSNKGEGSTLKMAIPHSLMKEIYKYDPKEAYTLLYTSQHISENIGNLEAMSWSMAHIAEIYFEQKNYDKSLGYFVKALNIYKQLNDKTAMAQTLQSIGRIMEVQKKYEKALNYYLQSRQLSREIKDINRLGNISVAIGHVYFQLQQFPKALTYYQDGLKKLREAKQPKGIAEATCNLGEYYIQQNNNREAVTYLEESYRISEQLGYPELIKHSSHLLSLAYERKGDGLLSVKLYKRYAFMKDSIENDENRKTVIRREVQFDFEKDRIFKEQEEANKTRLEKQRIERRNGLQHSMIFIAILLAFGITALLGFVKVSHYLAEGFIFVSVLILFEFLLVLTDPYVDGFTHGIPVYKLGMNTLLAILVFPLHTLFERKLKNKIKK